jgi:hypothetical protein
MDKGISFFSNFVYSLFIHAILLSFLLTLPVYDEEYGKKSLLGYFVYLAGGEDNHMKPSSDDGVSKNQVAIAQGQEQAMLSEKVIDEGGAEKKIVPTGLKDKRNEDVSSEFTEQEKSPDREKDKVERHEIVDTDKDKAIDKLEHTPEKPVLTEQALSIKEEKKSSAISTSGGNIVKPVAQEGSADKIPASPIKTDETAAVKKEEKVAEIPEVIDSASAADTTVQREKEVPAPEVSSEKADGISLRSAIEDNNKKVLAELPPKTEKAPEMTAKAKKPEPPRITGGTGEPLAMHEKGDAAKNLRQKGRSRKKMGENSGLKIPGAKSDKPILPDIRDIIKGIPVESYVNTETAPGVNGGAKISESPHVTGEAGGSLNGAEKAGSGAGNETGTEKEERAAAETKDYVENVPGAEAGKSSIGLSLDESLFYRDIRIEVLLKEMDNTRVYMYLLKNAYSSLRKKHKWGPEKEIGVTIQTIQKNSAEKEIKRVHSVAKAAEGIYTFVIDNRDVKAFETEVLFTLYGGQNRERDKTYTAVSVPPSAVKQFRFVLPDAVFWDDENHFTGNIEDSDSVSKFNDESGFVWREEKDY